MNQPEDSNSPEHLADKAQMERTKRVQATGWTAGVSAFFLVGALAANGSWPMAVGICAIAAMVAVACVYMLRER